MCPERVYISLCKMELGAETRILNPAGKPVKETLKAEHSAHWAVSSVVASVA